MKRWKLPNVALTLVGRSRAAEATGFFIPELRWLLDCGMVDYHIQARRLFLSHAHLDHSLVLPALVSAYTIHHQPVEVFAPAECLPFLDRYVTAAMELSWCEERREPGPAVPYVARGLRPGDRLDLDKNHRVDVVACDHLVPAVGFVFSETRSKLKEEHRGLPGPQIAALRARGVEVKEEVAVPWFAYLGDTSPVIFERHPEVLRAPVVICECTFLAPEHVEAARRTQHSHFADLAPILSAHPEVTFVLTHFSLRYRDEEVRAFFASLDPRSIANVVLWLDEEAG